MFLKDLWTREIAGGPIIDEGQETVQLSDDPRNVFSVGNQETMEGILIIVRMRQTGQEISASGVPDNSLARLRS